MRLASFAACLTFHGCSEKNLKITTTTRSPMTTLIPSTFSSSYERFSTRLVSEPFEAEPDDEILPSVHTGLVDLSEYSSSTWFSRLAVDLELEHRGDWLTWIGFGGPSMVEHVGGIYSYDAFKALFVLAGELGSRPVPADSLNLTQALGNSCNSMTNFAIEALSERRIRQVDVGFISPNSLYREMLAKAPFANLNIACPIPDDIRVYELILNNRIGRRLMRIAASNRPSTADRYEPSTVAPLATDLYWLASCTVSDIALGFRVKYSDDAAIGDGVFRDWIVKLGAKILTSDMFVFGEDGKYKTVLDSSFDFQNLWKFRAIGRFFALSLIEGISIGVDFNHALVAVLIGKSTGWTMDDLLAEDERFHESLVAIADCKLAQNCADFMLEFETKDGRNLRDPSVPIISEPVTEQNVDEYVSLTLRYELYGARREIYSAISSGFGEVLPKKIFNFIGPKTLGEIIKGSTEVDIAQLKERIGYIDYFPNDVVINWFWRFIEEGGSARAMQLIHFVTGLKSLPIGGVSKLPTRISIRKFPYGRDQVYPKAHLCYSALDLPDYPTEQELRIRVAEAIVQDSLGII